MRPRPDYIISKDEVYGYANHWMTTAVRLEYKGTKCSGGTLIQVLLIAASRVVSIFAARLTLPRLEEMGHGYNAQAELGDPAFTPRRCDPLRRL